MSQKQKVAVVVRGGVVARGKAKAAARVGEPRRSWVKGANRQMHVTANATQKVVSSGAQTWAGVGVQESNLMVTFDDDDDEGTPVDAGSALKECSALNEWRDIAFGEEKRKRGLCGSDVQGQRRLSRRLLGCRVLDVAWEVVVFLCVTAL